VTGQGQNQGDDTRKKLAQIEQAKVQQKQAYDTRKLDIDAYKAETDRASSAMAGMTPEQVQAIVMQTINDIFNSNNL
jgi:hypothetical protein